jgi:signal peptidase II
MFCLSNQKQQVKRSYFVLGLVLLILVLDQALKIWIKTHLEYGEEFRILGLHWARIHFVENEGMAFGVTLDIQYGKLILSLFRIGVVVLMAFFIKNLIEVKASYGLLTSGALIVAGAMGNIFDSAFYGMIFSESSYHGGVATMFPPEGGYASFLHGKVVDMFYFPMFRGYFPDWLPGWGGEEFLFFRPVFNIADAAITTGVLNVLFFHRSFFRDTPQESAVTEVTPSETTLAEPSAEIKQDEH